MKSDFLPQIVEKKLFKQRPVSSYV